MGFLSFSEQITIPSQTFDKLASFSYKKAEEDGFLLDKRFLVFKSFFRRLTIVGMNEFLDQLGAKG